MLRTAVLLVAVAACSDGKHACKVGATCEELATSDKAALGSAQHDCDTVKGTWQSSGCPAAGRIGMCAAGGSTVIYYGDGPDAFTVATASANCEHERHGTWAPAK